MLPWKAVLRGFLLAPLLPVTFVLGTDLILEQGLPPSEAVESLLSAFALWLAACYALSALFAFPLYLIGWRFLKVNLFTCLLGGALIGGVFLFVPFTLQYCGGMPRWDSESVGGVVLVENGRFTAAGIVDRLKGVGFAAAFGTSIALFFWWAAIKDNPAAQSQRTREGARL